MKKEKGFTLVELLAAVVILGLLMATAAGAFGAIKKTNAKKELEQVAESIKKIGETMYTSSVIRGIDLFNSDKIKSENSSDWLIDGSKHVTISECSPGQKGEITFGAESVAYNGCALYKEGLLELDKIENPYKKGQVCNIKLTLSKQDGKTVSQGCVICDGSKAVPDTETNLNVCK